MKTPERFSASMKLAPARYRPTFLDVAEAVLRRSKEPLTPIEIWRFATEWELAGPLNTEGKTPHKSMYARLYVDARENPSTRFVEVSVRPIRYALKGAVPHDWTPPEERMRVRFTESEGFLERELHPVLAQFAKHRLDTYVKTIRHESSRKSSYGKWLHPDLVGISYPIGERNRLAIDVAALTGVRPMRLSSFEVKTRVNFANLREAFFQAVSNSSWAHSGFLVAAEFSEEDDFVEELQRLSTTHGLGVIELDRKAPLDSEIKFAPRPRTEVDWATMAKLATMNPDFLGFLNSVRDDVQNGRIHTSDYDPVDT